MKKDPSCPSAVAVRQLRAAAGWAQFELAARSGLRATEVSKLECGNLKARSARVVAALAMAFGMSSEKMTAALNRPVVVSPARPASKRSRAKRGTKKAGA